MKQFRKLKRQNMHLEIEIEDLQVMEIVQVTMLVSIILNMEIKMEIIKGTMDMTTRNKKKIQEYVIIAKEKDI